MINPYVLRKWGALLFVGLFTTIGFYVGVVFYGFLIGLGTMFASLITSLIVGNLMLKHPFRLMLEGKGILFINLDSTGVLRPSIIGLESPYVKGKIGKKQVTDVWDRSSVFQISVPKKEKSKASITDKNGIKFELNEEEINKSRFAFNQYPVLIWNDQIKSFLTKDFFADTEKTTFSEHGILYLNRRIEELSSKVRDFARYVVETTKPKTSIWESKWTWIIIIIFIIILLAMFAPAIIKAIQGFYGTAGGAVSQATQSTNPITPR